MASRTSGPSSDIPDVVTEHSGDNDDNMVVSVPLATDDANRGGGGSGSSKKRKLDDNDSSPHINTNKEEKKSDDVSNNGNNNDNNSDNLLEGPRYTQNQLYQIRNDYDFFLVLYNCDPFKQLVEIIQPVLDTMTFKVVDRMTKSGKRFKGITVESMDEKKLSMIIARLKADEVYPELLKTQNFCVNATSFASLIKIVKQGCFLEMKRAKTSADLQVRCYNPNQSNYECSLTVPTIYSDENFPELNTMDYKFMVDLDLFTFKTVTRTATSLKAENIKLQIYEHTDVKKDTKITKVCISLDAEPGKPTSTHTFRSITKWDHKNAQTIITATDSMLLDQNVGSDDLHLCDADMTLVYDEKFSTNYLNLFVKSMEGQSITLKVSPDKPLVILYSLAGDMGFCHFIMAPVCK